jgi:hypothetical protein
VEQLDQPAGPLERVRESGAAVKLDRGLHLAADLGDEQPAGGGPAAFELGEPSDRLRVACLGDPDDELVVGGVLCASLCGHGH